MNKDTIRLTPSMAEVIAKMRSGWGLGEFKSITSRHVPKTRVWIQEGGCGKGGISKDIRIQTLHALQRLGLITIVAYNGKSSRTDFELTGLGKSIKL